MKKILCISGAFFLIGVLFLSGCKTSAAEWSNLYQAEDADDTTTEDMTEGTHESSSEIIDIEDYDLDKKTTVYVYVCGAVVYPGVYELPAGSRVVDAIEAAGGLSEDADSLLINQASIVEDGEQIRVYTKEEAIEASQNIDMNMSAEGKVNLNKASADELMSLPGIGESKAEAIISYRQDQGSFRAIEDIMKIPGIKEAVFSKIKDKITV